MTDVFMAVSLIFSNPLFRLEITIAVVVPYVGRQTSPLYIDIIVLLFLHFLVLWDIRNQNTAI